MPERHGLLQALHQTGGLPGRPDVGGGQEDAADADTRKKYYFRFYDPGVLRVFLPTATPKQRSELFNDVTAFFMEGEEGDLLRAAGEVG